MFTEQILFKESLFHTKYTGNTAIIDKHIEHILFFDKGRQGSNEGGFQSKDITFGFEELLTFAQKCAQQLEPSFILGNFWLNVNKGNNYNSEHIHELNGASAVYYHKVCCDKCPIYFKHLCSQVVLGTPKFYPKNGDLIFFPAYLPHGVEGCNNPEHERISLALNFKINKHSLGL